MSESIGKIKYETEEEMRARIEAEVRAKIEAEVKAKIEAEVKAKIEAEVREKMLAEERSKLESETVVSMPSADMAAGKRFARPYVEDHKLAAALDKAFDKLELYYPEGKVFALNSIDKDLCERISDLYKRAGYATVDDMLKEYGFKAISGAEVKGLRSFVMYSPGNEPDCIKGKVKNVLKLLEEYYPERVIRGGLESDHKSLAGKISGLYQWFGYEDRKSFLSAYGYDYVIEDDYNKGRPAQDFKPIIDALVEKYKNEPKPKNIGALLFENPEIKGKLKTLQNKSNELFGMSLKKYFEKLGILEVKAVENAAENASAPSKSQICDDARDELIARYVELDKNKFGTIEDALNCLKGMNVKLNKSGKVYIFRAGECDSAVTIPYGIDSISNKSFMNQQNLKEVVISASLTEIPSETFYGCPLFERIEIPEGVLSIGEKAFAGCVSLKEITLPESLQKIKSDAFVNCRALETVNMLNPMTLISDGAFAGCPFKYELPEEPEATDIKYFEYSIDSKKNVTITGFSGNQEKVVIPSRIEGYPVRTIKKGALQNCKYLTDLEMPDTITTMQGNAFKDCISLKRIHLSNSISKIITTSLNGCIGLKEINIPDCVTEIKRATFEDAPLEKLHIGKGLASICSDAFYAGKYDPYTGKRLNSRDINKVTIDSDNPYLKVIDSMVISKDGKILYAVLRNKKSVDIPEGIETICEYALEGLVLLSDVSLPDSLVTIGKGAFARTSIRSITFGDNVKKIGKGAFSYCQNLTAVVFNDGLEEIETNAFINSPIISIYLPSSLRVLGVQSFDCLSGYYGGYYYGDGNRQELLIDSSNPYLKTDGKALYTTSENKKTLQCLYRCQINEYTVQDGTTHIGNGAFHKCSNLSRIVLPEGLISIGQDAFANCSRITDVQLPQSIETIEKNAFRGTMLRKLVLGANVKDIGPGALITGNEWENKRPTLRNIKVDKANPYYYIDNKALMVKKSDGTSAVFMYFGGDETVIIPDGISEIAEGAFTRSIIQEIQIPSSVTVIGEKAFFGCAKLTRLKVGFAEPENGVDIAVVYIPEIKRGRYNYEDTQIRNQYMDCIRVDGSGSIFDFVKYDSLFETITTTKDKILIATDRLKSAIQLVPLYKDKYFSYLRRNAKKAVEIVVEYDDLDGLNTLAELNIFTGKNIDRIIEVANKAGKSEILSYLMNYKNSNIGIKETDYDL